MTTSSVEKMRKQYLSATTTHVVRTDCKIFDKETNDLVCIFRKNVIPTHLLQLVEKTKHRSNNRGDAAGPERHSNGHYRCREVHSNPVGIMASGKLSYWTRHNSEKAIKMRPLLQSMMAIYKKEAPHQYAIQNKLCKMKYMDLPLSSVAINHNFRCAVHKDKHNLDGTLGVMAVGGDNKVKGFELIFPEYNLAIDVRKSDVIIFNPHLYHCNGPASGEFQRISVVVYAR